MNSGPSERWRAQDLRSGWPPWPLSCRRLAPVSALRRERGSERSGGPASTLPPCLGWLPVGHSSQKDRAGVGDRPGEDRGTGNCHGVSESGGGTVAGWHEGPLTLRWAEHVRTLDGSGSGRAKRSVGLHCTLVRTSSGAGGRGDQGWPTGTQSEPLGSWWTGGWWDSGPGREVTGSCRLEAGSRPAEPPPEAVWPGQVPLAFLRDARNVRGAWAHGPAFHLVSCFAA